MRSSQSSQILFHITPNFQYWWIIKQSRSRNFLHHNYHERLLMCIITPDLTYSYIYESETRSQKLFAVLKVGRSIISSTRTSSFCIITPDKFLGVWKWNPETFFLQFYKSVEVSSAAAQGLLLANKTSSKKPSPLTETSHIALWVLPVSQVHL